jgi:hypothetical protein
VTQTGMSAIPEDSVNFGAMQLPKPTITTTYVSAQTTAGTEYQTATEGYTSTCPGLGTLAADEPSMALLQKGVSVLGTDTAYSEGHIRQLVKQLDRFKKHHLFLGQFEMLGRAGRRKGGAPLPSFHMLPPPQGRAPFCC